MQKCQELKFIRIESGNLNPAEFTEFKFPKLEACYLNDNLFPLGLEGVQNMKKNCPALHTIIAADAIPEAPYIHIPGVTILNYDRLGEHLVSEEYVFEMLD